MNPKSSVDELRYDDDDDDDHSEIFQQLEDAGQTNFDVSSEFGAHGLNSRNASAYNTFDGVEDYSNSRNVSLYRMASTDSGATPRLDCSTDTDLRSVDMSHLALVNKHAIMSQQYEFMLSVSSSYDTVSNHHVRSLPVELRSKSVSLEAMPQDNDESPINTAHQSRSSAVQELLRNSNKRTNSIDTALPQHLTTPADITDDSTSANAHSPKLDNKHLEIASTSSAVPLVPLPPLAAQGSATTANKPISANNGRNQLSVRAPSFPSPNIVNGTESKEQTALSTKMPAMASTNHPEYYDSESGDSDTVGSRSITLSIHSSVFDNSLAPSLQVTPSNAYMTNAASGGRGGFFRGGSFLDSHSPSPNMSRVSSALISPPQSYYGSGSGWVVPTQSAQQVSSLAPVIERPISSEESVVSSSSIEQAIQASLEEERLRRVQELAYRRAIEQAMQQSLVDSSTDAPNHEHYELTQHRMRLEQQRRIQLLQAMAQQYDTTTGGDSGSVADSESYGANSDATINSATVVVGATQIPPVNGNYRRYY